MQRSTKITTAGKRFLCKRGGGRGERLAQPEEGREPIIDCGKAWGERSWQYPCRKYQREENGKSQKRVKDRKQKAKGPH